MSSAEISHSAHGDDVKMSTCCSRAREERAGAVSLWGIDVESLRSTLAQLETALARPTMVARHWVHRDDQKHLLASISELVSLFGTVDLSAKRALAGLVPTREANDQSRAICRSLSLVSAAVHRHFNSQIDDASRRQLQMLLDFPAPNFLDALAASNSENTHSSVLAYLLSPRTSPGTAPAALERLTKFLPDSAKWVGLFEEAIDRDELSVRREVRTGGFWNRSNRADRMDLVISSAKFVIVIENKLWSTEHDHQTEGYWEWLSALPGEKAAIFLSPAGFKAQSPDFVSLSYLTMAWCFLGEVPARRAEEEVLLAGYFKSVFGNVLGPHLKAIMGDAA